MKIARTAILVKRSIPVLADTRQGSPNVLGNGLRLEEQGNLRRPQLPALKDAVGGRRTSDLPHRPRQILRRIRRADIAAALALAAWVATLVLFAGMMG